MEQAKEMPKIYKNYQKLGGSENRNLPILYVMKMALRRRVSGSTNPQNTLT